MVLASTDSTGTWRIPSALMRIPRTMAYNTDAMIPGTTPIVNRVTTGHTQSQTRSSTTLNTPSQTPMGPE